MSIVLAAICAWGVLAAVGLLLAHAICVSAARADAAAAEQEHDLVRELEAIPVREHGEAA